MKNRKRLIITVVQILAIIIFAFSYKVYNDNNVRPLKVYAFRTNLDSGVKVSEKDLTEVLVSQMTYTPDMILVTEKDQIIGRYTITKVFQNQIAYRQQLGDLNSSEKFASLDLANARLLSLPIDLVEGVAGDLQRGDKIDLLYKGRGQVSDPNEGQQAEFVYSKIFLQNIPVYQVNASDGTKYVSRANAAPNEMSAEQLQSTQQISSITLVVTPEQAEQIEARRLSGTIKILKRFPESETHETLGFVLGNYNKVFSGNANAETGSLQVIDSFTENDSASSKQNTNTQTNSQAGSNQQSDTFGGVSQIYSDNN